MVVGGKKAGVEMDFNAWLQRLGAWWSSRKTSQQERAVVAKKAFCRQMGVEVVGETGYDLETAFLDAKKKELELFEKRKQLEQEEARIRSRYQKDGFSF